jgi:hypothetical protein
MLCADRVPAPRSGKSRRLTAQYFPCFRTKGIAHLGTAGDLLYCGISIRLMTAPGQTRSFGDVGSMSGSSESGHG